MAKKDLKKQIEDIKDLIIKESNNPTEAEKRIKKLMSLKGQYDVVEAELTIPVKNVIKRYNFGSYEFVRCRNGILFHVFGGLHTFVSMRMKSAYEHLAGVLDMYDGYADASDDEKYVIDAVINATAMVMDGLIVGSCSDEALFSIAKAVVDYLIKLQNKSENAELQDETYAEDAEFENTQDAFAQTLKNDKND